MLEIVPDIQFKKSLIKMSGASLNECMQCGTCSVVCSLAPDDRPFPRKEMIWAGWGLKDLLLANTDIWLCHQCGDCSTHCPRGVKPADVLAAIREMTYRQYAMPKFMGEMMSNIKWLPLAILIPVLIIAGIISLAGTFRIPEGPVNYSLFFPHAWLNASFTLITLLSYGMAFTGLSKFWRQMKTHYPDPEVQTGITSSFSRIINTILMHSSFSGCTTQKSRKMAHLLVFYGFILLLAVTAYAIIAAVTHHYPLSITNPFKIAGNMAALMLMIGLGIMIINRLFRKENVGTSRYSDWLLLLSMLLLTLSGVIVELARFLNWAPAYHLYFFHLVCVWFVIIYLPYTKFGHMLYRTIALTFAGSVGRK